MIVFDELTTATLQVCIPNSMIYVIPLNAALYLTCLYVPTPTKTQYTISYIHM